MFQIHSSARTVEWKHSQPHGEVLSEQSIHGDFSATTSSGNIAHSSFVLDSRFAASLIIIALMFAIHLLPEGRSFLARFLVIKEYCGTIFSGFKCEEGGLTSYYIVEKRAQQTFLRGLQRHWNLEGRKYHSNCLLEVSDFGLYENIADLPF
ncbi:MAG: hypothetical protein B2I17_02600 [Thermoplasmatales archaeon B_DKE]|nr:MAG: hypothetical protein B2I17_02600 [Thermoplasmatales archaeon B_DKE]